MSDQNDLKKRQPGKVVQIQNVFGPKFAATDIDGSNILRKDSILVRDAAKNYHFIQVEGPFAAIMLTNVDRDEFISEAKTILILSKRPGDDNSNAFQIPITRLIFTFEEIKGKTVLQYHWRGFADEKFSALPSGNYDEGKPIYAAYLFSLNESQKRTVTSVTESDYDKILSDMDLNAGKWVDRRLLNSEEQNNTAKREDASRKQAINNSSGNYQEYKSPTMSSSVAPLPKVGLRFETEGVRKPAHVFGTTTLEALTSMTPEGPPLTFDPTSSVLWNEFQPRILSNIRDAFTVTGSPKQFYRIAGNEFNLYSSDNAVKGFYLVVINESGDVWFSK